LEPKRKAAMVSLTQGASDSTLLLLLRSYYEMEVKLNAYVLWELDGDE
jgi:hypothetical protein